VPGEWPHGGQHQLELADYPVRPAFRPYLRRADYFREPSGNPPDRSRQAPALPCPALSAITRPPKTVPIVAVVAVALACHNRDYPRHPGGQSIRKSIVIMSSTPGNRSSLTRAAPFDPGHS